MTTTYIYCLFDPITEQPKYIGKSDNPQKRYLEHIKEKGKTKKINWIKSLKNKGLLPILEILDEVRSENWKVMESMYIFLFRGWGFDLVNGTFGGDGSSAGAENHMYGKKGIDNPNYGKKRNEELKEQIRQRQTGKNNSFYGRKHTEESLRKISEASKGEQNPNFGGKYHTEEYFKKQSLSNSKVSLKVTDTQTGEVFNFINSKEAANFIGVNHGQVRMSKLHNYRLKRRYIIE